MTYKKTADVNVNVNECKLKYLLDSGYKRDIRTYGRNITAKHYMLHCCLRQAGA